MTVALLLIYITTASIEEAEKIGMALVQEKLAACANILPGMRSIYRWQGKIEQGKECVLIVKTRRHMFDALQTRVKALHSYDCPCIVAFDIVAGYKPFLDWIAAETTP
jgi:periplasmic divalent cation tolerance protein